MIKYIKLFILFTLIILLVNCMLRLNNPFLDTYQSEDADGKSSGSGGYIVSESTFLSQNTNCNSYRPTIIYNNGYFHVFYFSKEYDTENDDGADDNIAYRRSDNWNNRIDITTNTTVDSQHPKVAVYGTTLYVTYFSGEYNGGVTNVALRSSSDNWSTRTDITELVVDANYPTIDIDTSGTIHIAYKSKEYNPSFYNIKYRNSINWGTSIDVTQNAFSSYNPQIAVSSTGTIYVVYYSKEYSTNCNNIAMRDSSAWTTRNDITVNNTAGLECEYPKVDIETSDTLYVIYKSKEYDINFFNASLRDSGNWGSRIDATKMTAINIGYPVIKVDSSGKKHVIYYSKEYDSSYYNIAYRNSDDWNNRIDITSSTTYNSTYANMWISGNTVYIVYLSEEYNSNYDNVTYRTLTF